MALFAQILLIAAFVLFVLAGLGVPAARYSLGWFGAACAMLAWLIRGGFA